MNWNNRVVRLVAALSVAGAVMAQVPMQGGSALAADGYTQEVNDNSGNFLGLSNISNKDVISITTFGLVAYAVASTIHDSRNASGAAGGAATGTGSSGAGATGAGGTAPVKPVVPAGDTSKPIYEVVSNLRDDFSSLKELVDKGELSKVLQDQGPFTFFAPTNSSVTGAAAALAEIQGDKAKLQAFLQKHIIIGRYTIQDLKDAPDGKKLLTLSGDTVTITKNGGALQINGVTIVENDLAASNGWIHPINGVIQ